MDKFLSFSLFFFPYKRTDYKETLMCVSFTNWWLSLLVMITYAVVLLYLILQNNDRYPGYSSNYHFSFVMNWLAISEYIEWEMPLIETKCRTVFVLERCIMWYQNGDGWGGDFSIMSSKWSVCLHHAIIGIVLLIDNN